VDVDDVFFQLLFLFFFNYCFSIYVFGDHVFHGLRIRRRNSTSILNQSHRSRGCKYEKQTQRKKGTRKIRHMNLTYSASYTGSRRLGSVFKQSLDIEPIS